MTAKHIKQVCDAAWNVEKLDDINQLMKLLTFGRRPVTGRK
jgi:hypothetical protein